jgi:CHAT domain-containing protein/tetratricopeptide (TPR) repeat protein
VRRLLSSALALSIAIVALPAWAAAAPGSVQPADVPPSKAPRDPSRPAPAPHPTDATIDRALGLIDARQPARAERLLVALAARDDLTDRQRARAQRALGQAYVATGRHAEAAGLLARALESALAASDRGEAGWARRWAGTVHWAEGRASEARASWSAALGDFAAAGDTLGEFEALADLAMAARGLDRRPSLERCLSIARTRGDPLLEARARRLWAHTLLEAARPGPALVELERAVTLLRPLGRSAHGHMADALSTFAWALRSHGSNLRAVTVQREALRLAREAGDLDAQVWNYFGLGITLVELRRYEEADEAMRRGRAAAKQTGNLTTIRLLAESDGWIAMKKGDWARAVPAIEAAVAMPGVEITAMPLVNLADAYRHAGRPGDALATATRAATVARRLGNEDNELQALTKMAEAHVALEDLESADATLRGVIERLESYRAALAPSDFLKQGFGDRFAEAYGAMVHVLMARGRPADALASAERVRARAFADLLAARRARETDDAQAGEWLLGGGGQGGVSAVTASDSPVSVAALDAGGFAGLARTLSTTIVIYWLGEPGSYAWVVAPDGDVRGTSLPLPASRIERAARQAVDVPPQVTLSGASASASETVGKGRDAYSRLHAALWAPIDAWLPKETGARVTIVPHGALLSFPFGALRDRRGRYLVERYALHYAASGAVLLDASRRRPLEGPGGPRALLVADPRPAPSPEPGVRLPPLPAARAEVRSIARLLEGQSDVLSGSGASEASVRSALPGARVAHFATHALASTADPLGSHLVLGASGPPRTPDGDGRLTASEIAGLRLAGDLVVLAACRSARGPISSDGIAGLTRAFMAAGTPSVIAALWEIADEPTSRVMTRFYRGYAAGVPKDQALRAAQLALLADLRAGRVKGTLGGTDVVYPEHPWLWAAPILVGAP